MHKLNLHCHSTFSDSSASMEDLIKQYKALGFTCAVVTDHYYASENLYGHSRYSLDYDKWKNQKVLAEALVKKYDFPFIVGVEYNGILGEEILCFGEEFITEIFKYKAKKVSLERFVELKEQFNGATIMCHPQLYHSKIEGIGPAIDGFEIYNAGQCQFNNREIPDYLKGKTAFANSDTHHISMLTYGHNIVNKEIKSEEELVKFIQQDVPIELYAKCMDKEQEK